MQDPRYKQLAEVIVSHSCKVQAGEKVIVETFDIPEEFTAVLLRRIHEAGGHALCHTRQNRVLRELYMNAEEDQLAYIGKHERQMMEEAQCYIGLRGTHNSTEMADVPQEKMKLYQKHILKPVHLEVRVPNTKWVVLRWPSAGMAQQAHMSTESFEDFYFDVCTVDYAVMAEQMKPLEERMTTAGDVHIKGPGTDLKFSVKGIPAVGCAGEYNIPDGEVFTAPVKDSVEGTLSINTPSLYQGTVFDNIVLEFSEGKIVKATANHTEKIDAILDSDEGARYIGEFAIGFNPKVLEPMMDILFDEKIAGSFHFTPGNAYDDADNTNRSEVHWDLVTIQRPEYGGGEIWFDGELIRKDGLFVTDDLAGLNPPE